MELQLIHVGGEKRMATVIGRTGNKLIIRWGMAGLYNLDLKANKLIRAASWSAVDLEIAWQAWRFFAPRIVVGGIVKCATCRGYGECRVCKSA